MFLMQGLFILNMITSFQRELPTSLSIFIPETIHRDGLCQNKSSREVPRCTKHYTLDLAPKSWSTFIWYGMDTLLIIGLSSYNHTHV